jgi:hypothetical protein
MRHTHDALTQNWAERLGGEVARREETRVARRLYRQQEVDGVYRLEAGAVWAAFFPLLNDVGVRALLSDVHGTAIPRQMVPDVQ